MDYGLKAQEHNERERKKSFTSQHLGGRQAGATQPPFTTQRTGEPLSKSTKRIFPPHR